MTAIVDFRLPHDPDTQKVREPGQAGEVQCTDVIQRSRDLPDNFPTVSHAANDNHVHVADGREVFPPILYTFASAVHDVELQKNSLRNRLRILTTPLDKADEDGICRGVAVDQDHPEVETLRALHEMMEKVNDQATKNLENAFKRYSSLWPYVEATPGLGPKTVARLLGAIKDPYINLATGQPRTVAQLWAYAGLHVIDGESARLK